ncbi:MAG: YbjQ family protein [Catenulispora sp.]|nr:YbjQ family protein [Catenulispora sp.]
MLVVTSNEVPGYEIRAVYGEVFGLTVRSLRFGAGFTAGFRSMAGGEVPEMTKLVAQSRNEAMGRMLAEAHNRGANAVVAMRFDTGEIMQQWTEVCAYGTAVWVVPITDDAKKQYDYLVTAGQMPHQQAYRTYVQQ